MDSKLISKIDKLIEDRKDELVNDLKRLINIRSVKGEAKKGAPFGEGPEKLLNTLMEMGKKKGLFCKDYNVGVISLALKDNMPDLGIWIHGDVVAEGEGWNFEPFNATEYKGRIIGRGGYDNKGAIAVALVLLRIFKDLKIELNYNPALYVGSNEETGMKDLIGIEGNPDAKGFLNVAKPPRLSLVPDGGMFPVGYGSKGGLTVILKSKAVLEGFRLYAGGAGSPGRATAIFEDISVVPDEIEECEVIKDKKAKIIARTIPGHSSAVNKDGNMITKLANAILKFDHISQNDRKILEFLKAASSGENRELFGVDIESEVMGPLTMSAFGVDEGEGFPEIKLTIRYPMDISYDEIVKKVSKKAAENGFVLQQANRGVDPYLLDKDSEVVKKLNDIANEMTGRNREPFIMGGGTYANRLPNALVYGIDLCDPPEDFPKGYGGAHSVDECVSVERLIRGTKIYARALLALNEISF